VIFLAADHSFKAEFSEAIEPIPWFRAGWGNNKCTTSRTRWTSSPIFSHHQKQQYSVLV